MRLWQGEAMSRVCAGLAQHGVQACSRNLGIVHAGNDHIRAGFNKAARDAGTDPRCSAGN